jgi:hypothetical protein
MNADLNQTLKVIEQVFIHLCTRVPPPQMVHLPSGPHFRYVEQTIHQAIVQKLARTVSGLHSVDLLLAAGFIQEVGALQRVLDELNEDIQFLALGVIYDDIRKLHDRYLKAFYLEEFDADYESSKAEPREMVPRKKIRAYLANSEASGPDPSTGIKAAKDIGNTYSGYIHAASPHVMDMYGGQPAHFHVQGMLNTPRMEEHEDDLWNYFYRGLLATLFAAKAFGEDKLFDQLREIRDQLDATREDNAG